MQIQLILQGKSPTCGQHSVAMVTGQPIELIYQLFGHKKGTYTIELVRVLKQLGFQCSNQRKAIHKTIPELCILHVNSKSVRHWCVHHKGLIYCSGLGSGIFTVESYRDQFGLRIFSCIEILPP